MKKVADSAKELDESLGNVLDTVSNMIQGFSDIESGISGLKEASCEFQADETKMPKIRVSL